MPTQLVLRQGLVPDPLHAALSNYRGKLDQIPFDFPELLAALAPRPLFVNRAATRRQLPVAEC